MKEAEDFWALAYLIALFTTGSAGKALIAADEAAEHFKKRSEKTPSCEG